MTARSALEEALEYLINEDHDKAVEAFHEFVVQKARAIHETLIEDDDLDDEIDEAVDKEEVDEAKDKDEVDETKDEEVDEDKEEVDEAKKEVDEKEEKEVDESIADMRHNIRSDEYFGRDELTTEDDDDNGDEMEFGGDDEAEMDLGDENGMGMEGEEVVLQPDEAADLAGALAALQAKFDEIVGPVEEPMDDMGMEEPMGDMGAEEPMGDEFEEPAEESFDRFGGGRYMEGKDEEVDESDDSDDSKEVDEAVSHGQGVMDTKSGVDRYGKGGSGDSLLSNSDAALPEGAEFDFDLTEEDFLDLEEGLKAVNVQMGGEQGGVKFAGEETNTKSPVADKDSSKLLGTGSKDMISKQTEHGTYDLETAPTNDSLPHSGDNSHDKADSTGSPSRSQVSKGGGLDKQKGYGDGEVGAGKFAGTETNVKSPIGSQGTRNDS
ncbi:hypothetical protein LCGC14_0694620 [marine sediment metagenome]|uniref:Uncharacterized protein n=1 Tax=marine sediment metagenome TaxID=412755 RepID=A0A0F9R4Q7_9ZZZZ